MMHGQVDVRNPDAAAESVAIRGHCDKVFDKLRTELVTLTGAEKRSNIELLALKNSPNRTGLHI